MSSPVKSYRRLLLYLAGHFSTSSAKSQILGSPLTDSQLGWASATELSMWWLFAGVLWTLDLPAPRQGSAAVTGQTHHKKLFLTKKAAKLWNKNIFVVDKLLQSLLHLRKHQWNVPPCFSFLLLTGCILSKLPGISPACNFDSYRVVQMIFLYLRNA